MSKKGYIPLFIAVAFVFVIFVYPVVIQFTPGVLYVFGDKIVSLVNPGRLLNVEFGKTCALQSGECLESFVVDGPIWNGAADKFILRMNELHKIYPSINLVCFNSIGGINREAAAIAAYISRNKIMTCVGDMSRLEKDKSSVGDIRYVAGCSSACTFIVLAGFERIAIGNRFQFGLHSSREVIDDSSDDASSSKRLTNEAAALFEPYVAISKDKLQAIVEVTLRTPANRMYFASPKEQDELGFFSRRVGGGRK